MPYQHTNDDTPNNRNLQEQIAAEESSDVLPGAFFGRDHPTPLPRAYLEEPATPDTTPPHMVTPAPWWRRIFGGQW